MKIKWLEFKVFIIHFLLRMRLIKRVWYKSEIDLAKIKGEDLYQKFKQSQRNIKRERL